MKLLSRINRIRTGFGFLPASIASTLLLLLLLVVAQANTIELCQSDAMPGSMCPGGDCCAFCKERVKSTSGSGCWDDSSLLKYYCKCNQDTTQCSCGIHTLNGGGIAIITIFAALIFATIASCITCGIMFRRARNKVKAEKNTIME